MSAIPNTPHNDGYSCSRIIPKTTPTTDLYEFTGPNTDKSESDNAFTRQKLEIAPRKPPNKQQNQNSKVKEISQTKNAITDAHANARYVKKFTYPAPTPFLMSFFCRTFANGFDSNLSNTAIANISVQKNGSRFANHL